MNTNNSNINTGIASQNDEFQWFKPTGGVHVEAVKTSAPAFDIPPTPASSYSNLHVVLDTVHPSTETTIRSVVPGHFHGSSYGSTFVQPSTGLQSILPEQSYVPEQSYIPEQSYCKPRSSPMPSSSTPITNNRLDDIPVRSERAVPEMVNPEEPGIRSNPSLTSLKSEVAPMPSMAPRDTRWNDEWNKVGSQIKNKNWNLRHAPARPYAAQWNQVGTQIKNKNWNLRHVPSYADRWNSVGADILNKSWKLKHYQPRDMSRDKLRRYLDRLENSERKWRMHRLVNPVWSGKWFRVGKELKESVLPLGWAQWLNNLKSGLFNKAIKMVNSAEDVVGSAVQSAENLAGSAVRSAEDLAEFAKDSASAIVDEISESMAAPIAAAPKGIKFEFTAEPIDFTFKSRRVPDSIIVMEEMERLDRISRGIDAELSGKWYRIGRELRSYMDQSGVLADWLMAIKNRVGWEGHNLKVAAKDALVSLTTAKAPADLAVPRGMNYSYEPVDFTFKSRRVPLSIIQLEEAERAWRMANPINPILSGQLHKVGVEMQYKWLNRPTLANKAVKAANTLTRVASDAVDMASNLAGKSVEVMEDTILPNAASAAYKLSDKASELLVDAEDVLLRSGKAIYDKAASLAPVAPVPEAHADFAEHGDLPLNYYAFTAEPIDFTFKSRRCPASIIAAEEKERADRIAHGVDAVAYGKWNDLLSQPHTVLKSGTTYASQIKDTLAQSAHGWSNYLGSLAHYAADKLGAVAHPIAMADSMKDAAKDSLAGMSYGKATSVDKLEEAERLRRMNEKVSPVMMARLGRVQDELLKSVKSV